MKSLKSLFFTLCITATTFSFAQSEDDQKILTKAAEAKTEIMTMDAGLNEFFNTSAGYVVFPSVGKGGLIIGGASGNGVVYEGGKAVGMADLKKLNIGLQAGGQVVTEIIFFETAEDLADFKKGEFEFSAEASAVAIKEGAAVNAKYKDGVAVFAKPQKGLMADASVGGQKFSYKPL